MRTDLTICFVATNHGVAWGASEFLWAGAAVAIQKRSAARVVVCVGERSADVPVVAELRQAGCTILIRPRGEDEAAFGQRIVPERAGRAVLGVRPSLVVVSHGDNREGFPWMELCLDSGVPYVSVAHRASESDWPPSSVVARLRRAYLGAQRADFVSMHNLRLTERMICAALVRASVVRNPFTVDYASTVPWPGGISSVRLACVARFDLESKAIDVLLDVMNQPKWRQRPVQVDLVGREGPHLAAICGLIEYLGLESVRVRSSVDDIRMVWLECHGLVLPSRMEGLPIAIVEAMLAGRPCIGTDVGGVAEILEDGQTGWIAEAPTTVSLDRAMNAAWAVRSDWARIGARAAERIRELVPPDPCTAYAEMLVGELGRFTK